LDYLLKVWEAIKAVVVTRPAPFLIYQEGNAIVRALRDNFANDIGEILIDNQDVYRDACEFMERVMPLNLRKLKLYEDPTVSLFTRFQIETQIESAFAHGVSLPSGGSIVIDHTEALTAIDINSARSTKGEDIEETALNTNLEAAEEIARQLRIRDLGGLIVVDFIDMGPQRNQRDVENRLRDAVRYDRARIQIGKISRFGLLELSRQRLRPSLEESTQLACPRCNGNGVVRSVESLALAVLRIVGEEARKERTSKVIAQLPINVANYLLNEKRDSVQAIQENNHVAVVLVGDRALETPHYTIRRVRDDELQNPENAGTSYKLVQPKEDPVLELHGSKPPVKVETPAVSGVLPSTPAP
jgi:ribonuclease E